MPVYQVRSTLVLRILLTKSLQHGSRLRSGSVALRFQGVGRCAFDDPRAAGPLHCRDGPCGHIRNISIGRQVEAGRCTIALGLSVAVKNRRKLLPGDIVLWPEQAAAVADHDAVLCR